MKKQFIQNFSIFFICMIIDQLTKQWGLSLTSLKYNQGLMLGLGSELPASIRIITLSSIFGFIFFVYMILIYLLPRQLSGLKIGLSIFIGGIFGNVVDRTLRGRAIDFIPLDIGDIFHATFNVADVFQWIGAALIIYKIITKEDIIWYPENQRGKYLVNPKEQILFASKFLLISLCSSFLLGIFCFTFFRTSLVLKGVHANQDLLISFGLAYASLSLLFSIVVFFAGIIISHKTAGPLYAFENSVGSLLKGSRTPLILRDGDHYKNLEKLSSELTEKFSDYDKLQESKQSDTPS